MAQNVQKLTHQQRQEVSSGSCDDHVIIFLHLYIQAAQVRKEERKKAEKEKLLQETDPDKTRKWEVWRNL